MLYFTSSLTNLDNKFMATVFISMGSNLGDCEYYVSNAILQIIKLPHTKLVKQSDYYRSKPLGKANQLDYLNAVLQIETQLSPLELLDKLQQIESNLGRVRKEIRWSSRTIDLDILLYDDLVINSERLTVPHYDMKNREFVLYPLFEIAPALIFPDKKALIDIIKLIDKNGLTYWQE